MCITHSAFVEMWRIISGPNLNNKKYKVLVNLLGSFFLF